MCIAFPGLVVALDAAGAIIEPGDVISIHWSWACDRLTGRQLGGLMRWTSKAIAIANLTI